MMNNLTRRDFLAVSIGAAAGLAQASSAPAAGKEPIAAHNQIKGDHRDWSKIRGFNYYPSYAANLIETWERFDAATIAMELARGKRYFPGINALRWWHSWDAFQRDPKAYVDKHRKVLDLCAAVGCDVMPVLFNRTHLPPLDFGGIYIDHFLPGSALNQPGMFDDFLEKVVGGSAADSRIIAWDLCNEAYWYNDKPGKTSDGKEFPRVPAAIPEAEGAWLRSLYRRCKELGARAPLTVASWGYGATPLSRVNEVSDVLTVHDYFSPKSTVSNQEGFQKQLDHDVAFARQVGKPLLASECCWGNLDDATRVSNSRYELEQLNRRDIGFIAFVLHHSRMPDSHGLDGGPVGMPENLSFIRADGSLRAGHEFFNEF